jgi:2-polyprenyl-6-methoxyphenol hydroxylase-like FAD-dependent oxidoreductase
VLEIMAEIGLAERLHELPHTKVPGIPIQTPDGPLVPVDLRYLRSSYQYIMLVPQARFLDLITKEAARYPNCRLVMGANVRRLVEEGGTVRGVRYRAKDGWHEVRAGLVVGADGRNSKIRHLAGFEPTATFVSPSDTLWFRLPREERDPESSFGRIAHGRFVGMLYRADHWQVSYNIPKDSYSELKAAGLPALRRALARVLSEFATHLERLQDWRQFSLLSVESSRLGRWHRPGLLFIGDAAHVMAPALGVGINFAIQDAVVAANVLMRPLLAFQRDGTPVAEDPLAAVQRRRELPTRVIQRLQEHGGHSMARVFAGKPAMSSTMRRLLRAPVVRGLLARIIGLGIWRVHVRKPRRR